MSSDDNLQEPELTEALLPPGFLRNPVHLLAFGFGSGTAARAPGTWGSLAAIPAWFCFAWLPPVAYWGIVLLAFVIGIWPSLAALPPHWAQAVARFLPPR